ncbi:hypothetical protein BCR33DRAFT_715539 [Rhizoclosmatium globosum]|uniref:SAC domain-containing protein n=1 Tax=Rhizoclosmatium globosum TaxID=329046 RepID=A0A1Y2CHD4_9FUNG|nr:hypothetical protein BCR33DRAFT_715539 [Rhizoclosmatium globosum]|eukprot:ORY46461.1 hypothetical protein BCR33DRAFT_715539 [Rhizoclosmatium globosum]
MDGILQVDITRIGNLKLTHQLQSRKWFLPQSIQTSPLHVANTTADDSASESEQLLEEETKASDSSSVRTSRSTILGSLNSLAGGGKKDPVTPESIQPSDIKSLLELQPSSFPQVHGTSLFVLPSNLKMKLMTFLLEQGCREAPSRCRLTVAPLIQGFVEVRESVSMSSETSASPESTFDFALIRVEANTEPDSGCIVLQIRGSIPLYWTQVASTKTLNPTPSLDRSDEENLAALRLHVEELEKLYQAVVVVDLVGKEGRDTRNTIQNPPPASIHGPPNNHIQRLRLPQRNQRLNYDNLKHLLTSFPQTLPPYPTTPQPQDKTKPA